MDIVVHPADADRWDDVQQVMGANGGYGGCWCTFWRLTNQQAHAATAQDQRATLQELVRTGRHAGLLAYQGTEPVGWCSAAPRPDYPRLARTNGIRPDDPGDPAVWSVVCVFVQRGYRGQGVADTLLSAAVDYAREHGASMVEGYPVADPSRGNKAALSSGTIGLFTRAGFTLQLRPPGGRRVVMRRGLR